MCDSIDFGKDRSATIKSWHYFTSQKIEEIIPCEQNHKTASQVEDFHFQDHKSKERPRF